MPGRPTALAGSTPPVLEQALSRNAEATALTKGAAGAPQLENRTLPGRSRLPRAAEAKLKALRVRQSEASSLNGLLFDEFNQLLREKGDAINAYRRLTDPQASAAMGGGGDFYREDHPAAISARKRIDEIAEKMRANEAARHNRGRQAGVLATLLGKAEAYYRGLPAGITIEAVDVEAPALAGETGAAGVARLRQQRLELIADCREIEAAPVPSHVMKAKVRPFVEALAERGRPNLYGLLEGSGQITLARSATRFDLQAFTASEGKTLTVHGNAGGEIPDGIAHAAWLDPERMIARLEEEIDAIADDDAALSDDERAARESDLRDRILHLERIEEALIEASPDIPRRPDMDPRALLSISGPSPREGAF